MTAGGWVGGIVSGVAAVFGIALYFILRQWFVVVTVQGVSMLPAYESGDRVLVRRGRVPSHGCVVVVEGPCLNGTTWHEKPAGLGGTTAALADRQWLIKRVAGVPGDRLPSSLHAYCKADSECVPDGALFLLGDNAKVSLDSRQVGFFPIERVLGTVVRRI